MNMTKDNLLFASREGESKVTGSLPFSHHFGSNIRQISCLCKVFFVSIRLVQWPNNKRHGGLLTNITVIVRLATPPSPLGEAVAHLIHNPYCNVKEEN